MKNKISMIALGVLAVAVAGLSAMATVQFASYGKEVLTSVFDRQTSTPSYGEPWQERYRLSGCTLYQESTKGFGKKAVKSMNKVKSLNCEQLDKEMNTLKDGKYSIQSTYFNNIPLLFGFLLRGSDLNVLTPVTVNNGKYSCDYDAEGWKTAITAMPYGRIGLTPTSSSTEPAVVKYLSGDNSTVIVEEQKGFETIPHDFRVCPVVGRLNGPGVKDGEVRLNWGFVSLKNMNMLVIQNDGISYYDAAGKKVRNFDDGTYTLSFPDIYKDYSISMDIKGKKAVPTNKKAESNTESLPDKAATPEVKPSNVI